MNKFISLTYLAFLAYIILSLVPVSTALSTNDVSLVNKRNQKCPCATAIADFNKNDRSKLGGLVMYFQDEVGETSVTGYFSRGFQDKNKTSYEFLIKDDCGNTVHDLSSQWREHLELSQVRDSTNTFHFKNNNFNLNCDSHGILLVHTKVLNKRNSCVRLNKRDGYGTSTVIMHNGAGLGAAHM
ncbi:hypothetical protein C1645_741207 [Glomus cerebriforme]|uniref:Uncharacterized protein n=1 Tax=Glomus cerebriforme TaxID=658196 RepID=A0A397SPH2_9GLOM|nr:hypothetical protein C1645_741207 [Glomus cerebriforme]